ncbi:MAG: peptide ABC transporter substrate-binding protein [Rubrobacteraceae bacterium]
MALAGLVAAGCGGGGGQEDQGGNGGGGGGANLTVGYDQEPDILNGFIVGGDLAATADMTQGILDKPYEIQPDLSIAPQLAQDDPEIVSEEPLVIEYQLKEGLQFSDGEPLTSEDAKFTYEQIMKEENDIITREGFDKIESFETPDEQTVRITFSEPYAPWRDVVSGSYAFILPKHIYEGQDFNNALNNEVVGSGPYQLREWNKGQNLILEKNENYWGDEPQIDQITYRFIPDTNTLNTSLQSGEVQFINPPPDIGLKEKLEGYSGVNVDTAAGTVWEHIAFNLEKVQNKKLREAVAYGVNRQQILEEILPGQVEPLNSVLVPEQDPYYTPAFEKYGFDPDRARQLVEEAVAEGADPTITFSTTSDNNLRETLQQVVQQQLQDVGITVNIENTAAQTFFGEWTPQGNFQMGEWAWLATPEPTLTALFGADAVPPDGQNYYRWKNQEATQLMKQADVTVDEAERADLTQQVQEMMADDLPVLPLYQRPVYYAYAEGLEGPEVNPTLAGPYWNVDEWSLSQ